MATVEATVSKEVDEEIADRPAGGESENTIAAISLVVIYGYCTDLSVGRYIYKRLHSYFKNI